ncbi:hypothetical protein P0Y31_14340 [Knoellia sp. 3-2P3]|uniref:hypothetical protein n=1 Tax=unclassified Knoellia TaxID=2618719 RepID=UPI0023DB9BF1|nr:hypothetical protein [Knoellia sp. 3-2P3]MDF2093528.1 hypothetical protein [Knoellia sp. 3-2P3]
MNVATTSSGGTQTAVVPVSRHRLQVCLRSTDFWVEELPRYADRKQKAADFWALLSGVIAALTGLAIWPVVNSESGAGAKALVSVAALIAAVCALVPRVMSYGELAGQARELSSRYGELKGSLIDLVEMPVVDQGAAHDVVARFQGAKEKKDSLRGLPDRVALQQQAAMQQRRDAEARLRAEGRVKAAKEALAR